MRHHCKTLFEKSATIYRYLYYLTFLASRILQIKDAPKDLLIFNSQMYQENSRMLIFYLICLNPLKLKLSKIREKKNRTGLILLIIP